MGLAFLTYTQSLLNFAVLLGLFVLLQILFERQPSAIRRLAGLALASALGLALASVFYGRYVPIFLDIAPDFTEDSEIEAIRYHSEHFDRNLVLITATELKALAEEWSSPQHKNRETPFPLGLLAASGRYDRRKLGKLVT